MAYVHFYELFKRVPRARRKFLASFIHELKKLCGRKYHVAVCEMLENCCEDYVFVERGNLSQDDYVELVKEVAELCDNYSIPNNNICDLGFQLEISLYTDF